ncbi:MAG: chorismate mutase [Anaerovoracaceae bacterium]
MKDLEECRKEIDEIDELLVKTVCRRFSTAADIAAWKRANGRPVRDPEREEKKIAAAASMAPAEMEYYIEKLYNKLLELTREYEEDLIDRGGSPGADGEG